MSIQQLLHFKLNSFSAKWSLFSLMKSENFISLKIFKYLVETSSFKSSRTLNISNQVSLLQMLIRLSSFISISIKNLTQTTDLEVNNSHKINSISHLIRMMIKIKILTVIEIMIEIITETEIKETETEIIIMIMKTEAEVKITIEDSDFIMSV